MDFARVLSECPLHLGEYAANRGRHGERGERGKQRFFVNICAFFCQNARCIWANTLGQKRGFPIGAVSL